ncbi:MAG: peptidylprolyl isomerase [Gemmataceae bacterium]|nr:peptidylprolyl isomerase [Gemmataceae bacterium]
MRQWVLLGVLCSSGAGVAADPPAGAPGAHTPGSPAATVDGEPIPLDRVDAVIRAKYAVGPLTPTQLRHLRAEVLSDLIDDHLLAKFLARYAPKVDPAEVDAQLKAFADDLARKGKTLAAFLKETNQTEAEVRAAWTGTLALQRYVAGRVGDDQLRKYYEANKDYFDRVEVRVGRVVLRVGAKAPPADRAAAREKLRAVRADILAGKLSFADAARRYSQCPAAAAGGDLGYILRKDMLGDEEFCRAAFALKPGELSEVVETEAAVHLIRVADRKAGTPTTFERCREEVREAFADDYRAELCGKLRKDARVELSLP